MEWRPIPGFPGYEAAEDGGIRPTKPRYKNGRGAIIKPWIVCRHGRDAAYVTLYVDGKGHKHLVHRLVALAFHGPPPAELTDCCHKNHDSLDNRAANLRWGTHSENIEEQWEQRHMMQARLDDALGIEHCYNPQDSDIPF